MSLGLLLVSSRQVVQRRLRGIDPRWTGVLPVVGAVVVTVLGLALVVPGTADLPVRFHVKHSRG